MLFLNPLLVLGLLGISVPILLHIFKRRSAKPIDWGAMRFLVQSMASRTRRIELEDALLMASRCLIFACLALALARPFSPPGSLVPWAVVLPLLLLAVAATGAGFALWQNRRLRWTFLCSAMLLFLLVGAALHYEREWNLRRLGGSDQDVALIIDASTSMTARFGGKTQFERAIQEAHEIVNGSGRDTAFSIILAGPSPVVLSGTPRTSRRELNRLLSDARPSDGAMALTEALVEAAAQLSKGERRGQRIVLISDGQAHGWSADSSAAWAFASKGFSDLPTKPQLVLRRIDSPAAVRNLSVTDIAYSRDAIGTDRPVEIEVTLENTGTESVTPGGVQLRVGEILLEDNSLGQMVPGLSQTVRFSHQFERAGAHAVVATAIVEDNLAADNSRASALTITGGIKVLIVDGNPGGRYFDRASAFLEIALAPGMAQGAAAMLEPVVLPAPQIPRLQSFDEFGAVILADVQRLPADTAARLAAYVVRGGGLLIAPGKRAEPQFYNRWMTDSRGPLLPATLNGPVIVPADARTPVSPSPGSFDHRALRKAGDAENGDLGGAQLAAYWNLQAGEADREAAVIARLNTGEPFVALSTIGSGSVLLTCCPLDNRASNIATQDSFLPLVHELVYYLAKRDGETLNLPAAAGIALRLDAEIPADPGHWGVLDPRGETRSASLSPDGRGLLARIPGDAMAGLYEMEVPSTARAGFEGLLTKVGTVPFSVSRAPEEALLTPLSKAQLVAVGEHFEVLQPGQTADVLTILAGKSFGEELWKYLAVGALLLLLAEAALARWIARSRKTGSQDEVEFERHKGPGKAFVKALGKLRKEAA